MIKENNATTISNARFARRTESDGIFTEKSETIAVLSVCDTAVDKVCIREISNAFSTRKGAVSLFNGGCYVLL